DRAARDTELTQNRRELVRPLVQLAIRQAIVVTKNGRSVRRAAGLQLEKFMYAHAPRDSTLGILHVPAFAGIVRLPYRNPEGPPSDRRCYVRHFFAAQLAGTVGARGTLPIPDLGIARPRPSARPARIGGIGHAAAARQQQLALARVARQRRGMAELGARLGEPSEPGQQLSPHAWQQVIRLERRIGAQRLHQIEAGLRPE